MEITCTPHAKEECQRRKIPIALLEQVLSQPQQVVPSYGNRVVYQSQLPFDGKIYLLRAIVDQNTTPNRVVTVYKTSKIEKYWRTDA